MLDRTHAVDTAKTSIPGNSTAKAALLSRAKAAIEAGDQSLHDAAEALAIAQQDFNATQREIAEAVGKSAAWVNRLLQWQGEGCAGSPFGPGSKAGRERQKRVQSTEQQAPLKVDADNSEASAEKGTTDRAKREAEPNSRARRELAEFKHAVDIRFPHMDKDTRREGVAYAIAKGKVETSCVIDK
jgi:predicted transcriptional regulator